MLLQPLRPFVTTRSALSLHRASRLTVSHGRFGVRPSHSGCPSAPAASAPRRQRGHSPLYSVASLFQPGWRLADGGMSLADPTPALSHAPPATSVQQEPGRSCEASGHVARGIEPRKRSAHGNSAALAAREKSPVGLKAHPVILLGQLPVGIAQGHDERRDLATAAMAAPRLAREPDCVRQTYRSSSSGSPPTSSARENAQSVCAWSCGSSCSPHDELDVLRAQRLVGACRRTPDRCGNTLTAGNIEHRDRVDRDSARPGAPWTLADEAMRALGLVQDLHVVDVLDPSIVKQSIQDVSVPDHIDVQRRTETAALSQNATTRCRRARRRR